MDLGDISTWKKSWKRVWEGSKAQRGENGTGAKENIYRREVKEPQGIKVRTEKHLLGEAIRSSSVTLAMHGRGSHWDVKQNEEMDMGLTTS